MENHQRKINIFIPIEIIKRELLSKLYLPILLLIITKTLKPVVILALNLKLKS